MNRTLPALALALAASPALAQSSISSTNKFAWNENCGWMNWRDSGAPAGAQGARVASTYLAGFVWCENVGYLNLGDGTPGVTGAHYTNASGQDHGVNILAGGDLAGYAWGENIGWVNFGTAPAVPPAQRARLDSAARRFRGYAWGENTGWINLDDATNFVGLGCYPDCNGDGALTVADFGCFQTKFVAGCP